MSIPTPPPAVRPGSIASDHQRVELETPPRKKKKSTGDPVNWLANNVRILKRERERSLGAQLSEAEQITSPAAARQKKLEQGLEALDLAVAQLDIRIKTIAESLTALESFMTADFENLATKVTLISKEHIEFKRVTETMSDHVQAPVAVEQFEDMDFKIGELKYYFDTASQELRSLALRVDKDWRVEFERVQFEADASQERQDILDTKFRSDIDSLKDKLESLTTEVHQRLVESSSVSATSATSGDCHSAEPRYSQSSIVEVVKYLIDQLQETLSMKIQECETMLRQKADKKDMMRLLTNLSARIKD